MKIKLHIGANKTGSSAIQRFLRRNSDVFAERGFAIPTPRLNLSGPVTGEHSLAFELYLEDDFPGVQLNEALIGLQNAGCETVIISAETLSNPGRATYYGPVFAQFDTSLLLYIRRQDDLLLSTWQQWASKRETHLDRWLGRATKQVGRWLPLVRDWEQYIGRDNMNVRVFDRDFLRNRDVRYDALDFFAPEADVSAFEFSATRENLSFSNEIVPLVSGKGGPFESVHDNRFYSLVQDLTGDTFATGMRVSPISPQKREDLMKAYAAENEELRSLYFPEQDALFKPIDHGRYHYLDEREMQQRQLRFMTRMIFELGQRVIELEASMAELTAEPSDADLSHRDISWPNGTATIADPVPPTQQ